MAHMCVQTIVMLLVQDVFASRSVIIMWLTVMAGGTYLMENPQHSLVAHHPRYLWMVGRLKECDLPAPRRVRMLGCVTKTYKVAFWMRKWGALSFKRTWVWSSSSAIKSLDLGPLTKAEKKNTVATTDKYYDSKGKLRFKGNARLKATQRLGFAFPTVVFCWNQDI